MEFQHTPDRSARIRLSKPSRHRLRPCSWIPSIGVLELASDLEFLILLGQLKIKPVEIPEIGRARNQRGSTRVPLFSRSPQAVESPPIAENRYHPNNWQSRGKPSAESRGGLSGRRCPIAARSGITRKDEVRRWIDDGPCFLVTMLICREPPAAARLERRSPASPAATGNRGMSTRPLRHAETGRADRDFVGSPRAMPANSEGPQPVEVFIRRALAENRTVQAAYHNVQSLKYRLPQVTALDDPSPRTSFSRSRASHLSIS